MFLVSVRLIRRTYHIHPDIFRRIRHHWGLAP